MTTFTFLGNSSFNNRGCEAIARGSLEVIKKYFQRVNFYNAYFYDGVPDDKNGRWDRKIDYIPLPLKIPSRHRNILEWIDYKFKILTNPKIEDFNFFLKAKKAIKKSEAVLMIGGDNYSFDYGVPKKFFNLNRFVMHCDKPIILWGASVGPFSRDPDYEMWVTQQLRKVKRIYARETKTIEYLEKIGVVDNVVRVADPAFVMPPEQVVLPEDLKDKISKGAIGINISPLLAKFRPGSTLDEWMKFVANLLNQILKQFSFPLILIPHVTLNTKNIANDDHVFLNAVHQLIDDEEKSRVYILGRKYNAAQIKWIISQLPLFIGARTHSTIASLSSAVPTIVLAYSMKGEGIIKDIFHDDQWMIKVEEMDANILCKKISQAMHSRDEIREQLNESYRYISDLAFFAGEDLKLILGKKDVWKDKN